MAAPAVATTEVSGGASATTLTVTMPAGISAGDLLLAHVSIGVNRTITAPSGGGWNLVYDSLNVHRCATYWKIAGGSEPASYDWTLDVGTTWNASALRITGAHASAPVEATAEDVTASNLTSPSVITLGPDRLIVRLFSMGRDRTFTEPSGYTKRTDALAGSSCDNSTATITQAVAGASGTAAWSLSGAADRSIHHALAIAPPASASGNPHYYRQQQEIAA